MSKDLYYEVQDRSFGVYTHKEQEKLRASNVAIIGQGCVGELSAVISVRLGIGNTTIVDFDNLEISNLNRNAVGRYSNIGKPKVENMAEFLQDANPTVNVNALNVKLDENNVDDIIIGHDIVIQALDNMASRVVLHRSAYRLGIPCITMSGAPPFRSMVTTVLPFGIDYETLFSLPSAGKKFDGNENLKNEISFLNIERAKYSAENGAVREWADGFISGNRRVWSVTPSRAYLCSVICMHEAANYLTEKGLIAPAPKIIDINLCNPVNLITTREPENDKYWDYREF